MLNILERQTKGIILNKNEVIKEMLNIEGTNDALFLDVSDTRKSSISLILPDDTQKNRTSKATICT